MKIAFSELFTCLFVATPMKAYKFGIAELYYHIHLMFIYSIYHWSDRNA